MSTKRSSGTKGLRNFEFKEIYDFQVKIYFLEITCLNTSREKKARSGKVTHEVAALKFFFFLLTCQTNLISLRLLLLLLGVNFICP